MREHPSQVFRLALAQIRAHLKPERVLVLYGNDGKGSPFVRAAQGVQADSVFTTGEISLELLRQALSTGEPLCMTDAMQNPRYADRTSAVLAGIRSVLCAPLRNAGGKPAGLLYVDSRIQVGAFKPVHLEWLLQLASEVSARLHEPDMSLEPPGDSEWQSVRESGLGSFRAGHLEAAEADLAQARDLAELWGVADPRAARSKNELGELYRAQKRYAEAEELLREAVAILEARGTESQSDLAAALNNLGGLLYELEKLSQAEQIFRRALDVWQRVEPNHPQLVPVLSNLATLRQRQDDFEGAEKLCARALAVAEQAWGATHPNTVRCRTKHQELLARLGKA